MTKIVVNLTTNCTMKMKHKAKSIGFRYHYIYLIINIIILIGLEYVKKYPFWIEDIYTKQFYPVWTYIYVILFSWVPFSVGDVFYGVAISVITLLLIKTLVSLFEKNIVSLKRYMLLLVCILLTLYNIFYINWGLHYFRVPLVDKIGLDIKNISEEQHEQVLFTYIDRINELRDDLDFSRKHTNGVKGDLSEYMYQDTLFDAFLTKSQIHLKNPISSELVSYFTVSGYFNPFTLEAHVNQSMPLTSYPFVVVHELAHQMGIGFEDECNFIAFAKLYNHNNPWYRYAAYYAALEYLIAPYGHDNLKMDQIRAKLSPKVLADYKEERAFWMRYRSKFDRATSWFYNHFLIHNNQPEGLIRYSMMSRLVVAWEIQQSRIDI